MSDNPHESPHERIFLQYWMDEPSWRQDRVDGCVTGDDLSDELDTEYVRLDVHEAEIERLREELAEAERVLRVEIAETSAQRRRAIAAEELARKAGDHNVRLLKENHELKARAEKAKDATGDAADELSGSRGLTEADQIKIDSAFRILDGAGTARSGEGICG